MPIASNLVRSCSCSRSAWRRSRSSGSAPDDELAVPTAGWETDFSKHSAPLSEFVSGWPGKERIPSIEGPQLVSVEEAGELLSDREPVIELVHDGIARAYPIQILLRRDIVNDEVTGTPVAVTFCPLCNTALAFDRRVEGEVLDFGTTGNLRNSDLACTTRRQRAGGSSSAAGPSWASELGRCSSRSRLGASHGTERSLRRGVAVSGHHPVATAAAV